MAWVFVQRKFFRVKSYAFLFLNCDFILVFLVLKLILEQVNVTDFITLCFVMLSAPTTAFYEIT